MIDDDPGTPPREDPRRTARDIRMALAFGIIAASLEMGLLLYFFR